jgi:anti-anti-sigma factor
LVSRQHNLAFVQVVGRGAFENAHLLKSFYTGLLQEGVQRFVVDLSACTYLDSTFLGTLAGLGIKLRAAGSGRLHIVNVTSRNIELLQNLGLDRVFAIDICALDFKASPAEVLQTDRPPDPVQAGEQVLEAHLALIEADARNLPKFKDVITFLREDLAQKSGPA